MRSPCQGFDESYFGGSECRFLAQLGGIASNEDRLVSKRSGR
jgi:hypothetical protein